MAKFSSAFHYLSCFPVAADKLLLSRSSTSMASYSSYVVWRLAISSNFDQSEAEITSHKYTHTQSTYWQALFYRVSQKKVPVFFNFFPKMLCHKMEKGGWYLIGFWMAITYVFTLTLLNVQIKSWRLTDSEKSHWRLVSRIYAKWPWIKLILAK